MSSAALPELESGARQATGSKIKSWYYGTLAQAIIIGLVSFFSIGMYNALSGLGAGGLASATVWNQATAMLFAFLCVTCCFAPVLVNQFPLRYSLALSCCSYTLYAASLYLNSKNGTTWFLLLANAINGIGAGLMFAVEGAVVVGYPEQQRRGKYIALWIAFRNLGPIVGGSILLGLNVSTDGAGSIGLNSYAVFIGLLCVSPFIALLLASPEKVQRQDGTKVVFHKTTLRAELKQSWRFLRTPKVLLLLPIFFCSWFADSFVSTYNSSFYTVRVRALSSLVTPCAGNIGSFLVGLFLDSKLFTRRRRALMALGFFCLFNLGTWAYAAANTAHYESLDPAPRFDWTSDGFGRAYLLTFFTTMEELGCQSLLYFFVGCLTDDLQELVHLTGILRGVEGAGQAVAYGISGSTASHWVTIGIGFGLCAIAYPSAYLALRDMPEDTAVLTPAVTTPPEKADEGSCDLEEK